MCFEDHCNEVEALLQISADKYMECDLTLMVCRLDRSLRTCLEHTASPGLRAVADSEGKHPPYGHAVVESCPETRSCTWRALQLCAHLLASVESALILRS